MQNFMSHCYFISRRQLSKLYSEGFKRAIYWNEYKIIENMSVHTSNNTEEKSIRQLLDSSYQGVKRLFFLAYNNKEGDSEISIDSYQK